MKTKKQVILESLAPVKATYENTIILCRVGDFYVAYEDDALRIASLLDLMVTKEFGLDIAGFPFHKLDTYLPRLIRGQYRVAIMDDPTK